MHRLAWPALALALLVLPAPSRAEQNRCPLSMDSCIVQFGLMRERPWLGVFVETDSTGHRVVRRVQPGSPAEKAGFRPGDVLVKLNGLPPEQYFATRAGWKTGDRQPAVVLREGGARTLGLVAEPMPEEWFARIVGEHMLDAHLAYMDTGGNDHDDAR